MNPGSRFNPGTETSGVFIVAALRTKARALYRQMQVNALLLRDIARPEHCFSFPECQDKNTAPPLWLLPLSMGAPEGLGTPWTVTEFCVSTFAKRAVTATTT